MVGKAENRFRVTSYLKGERKRQVYCETLEEARRIVQENLKSFERCTIERNAIWTLVETHERAGE